MINTKQRWVGILFGVLIIVYIIFYFSRQKEVIPEVVEIYFADRVTAAHKVIIDSYNKKMEGKVKVIPIDFPNFDFSTNERKEILARSLRGRGDSIDLFAVDVIWAQRFAKWCEPLDKYFTQEEIERFVPEILESCYNEGELVAVPLDMVFGIMYYRHDLVSALPNGTEIINKLSNGITWSDFIRLRKAIDPNSPYYVITAADYEGLICAFVEILLGIEPGYFELHGFNFNTPVAKKAVKMMVDLIYTHNVIPAEVLEFTEVPSYQYFIKNDGYFLRGWPSYDKDFTDSPVDLTKEKQLRKTALPRYDNGKAAYVQGGWHVMISKFSNKKEYIVDFLKYLLSDESQELFYKESGYLPVVNTFFEDSVYLKKYPDLAEAKKYMPNIVHRPLHVDYTRYSKIISSYLSRALRKELSVEVALKRCTDDIQLDQLMSPNF
jgi:multiple sugar transport system substrate-binding protein